MKFSRTKVAIALLAIFASGATLASGVNFSNLSLGTITNLTISQTGAGFGRISNGAGLTSAQGAAESGANALTATAGTGVGTLARGVTFTRAADGTGTLVHSGSLTTLSLTQVNAAATAVVYNTPGDSTSGVATAASTENAITGALYTTGGSVTVLQGGTLGELGGTGNVVDFAIGASGAALTTPTILITQKGNNNQTELTRTGGTNTDTIASYGNSNTVKVTGSATGTNSVDLTFGSDGTRTSSSNQATVSQTGSANTFTGQVTGSSNILDVGQSATTATLTLTGMTGDSNQLYVRQSGSSQTATITNITGNSNKVDLTQSGTSNVATITLINGASNNVDITQAGSTQEATLSLTGSSNTVSIMQTSAATSAIAALTLTNATSATVRVTQSTAGANYAYAGTVPSGGSITVTQ